MKQPNNIRVAVVGIGNCFSALYQGLHYYRSMKEGVKPAGIMFEKIGGYTIKDIDVVAAFDVDKRKVGRPVGEAIFAEPNCARTFHPNVPDGPIVSLGKELDGVSDYMKEQPEKQGFRPCDSLAVSKQDIVQLLKDSKADILINYCPVGSEEATKFYAECSLEAEVPFLNCIPVFIASDPVWAKRFTDAGVPIIGDDMRSQFGASIMSQVLQEAALDRGMTVRHHSQLNVGGNTDFNNMMVPHRLASKKESKENVIKSQNILRGIPIEDGSIFAGPSTFISHLKDNKVCHIHMDIDSFAGAAITVDVKLSVQDSENSAGIVVDAIRYLKVASDRGVVGPLLGPSAWTQKTPPQQLSYNDARESCVAYAEGEPEAL